MEIVREVEAPKRRRGRPPKVLVYLYFAVPTLAALLPCLPRKSVLVYLYFVSTGDSSSRRLFPEKAGTAYQGMPCFSMPNSPCSPKLVCFKPVLVAVLSIGGDSRSPEQTGPASQGTVYFCVLTCPAVPCLLLGVPSHAVYLF